MSGSVNKVILVGNLGNDPEVRIAPDRYQVCTFNLATSRGWRDRSSGEQKSQTYWHKIVVWNPNAVNYAINYLKKGAKVYVEGKLETRKWQDKTGLDRYTTEVVIRESSGQLIGLDSKDAEGISEPEKSANPTVDFDLGDVPF